MPFSSFHGNVGNRESLLFLIRLQFSPIILLSDISLITILWLMMCPKSKVLFFIVTIRFLPVSISSSTSSFLFFSVQFVFGHASTEPHLGSFPNAMCILQDGPAFAVIEQCTLNICFDKLSSSVLALFNSSSLQFSNNLHLKLITALSIIFTV